MIAGFWLLVCAPIALTAIGVGVALLVDWYARRRLLRAEYEYARASSELVEYTTLMVHRNHPLWHSYARQAYTACWYRLEAIRRWQRVCEWWGTPWGQVHDST